MVESARNASRTGRPALRAVPDDDTITVRNQLPLLAVLRSGGHDVMGIARESGIAPHLLFQSDERIPRGPTLEFWRRSEAAAGRPAHIVLKLNAIVDVPVIEALYRAASAGVEIDLIVRGACSLQPGLPGISERVRVRSIIGEFLEHSRIWGFTNGGDREWYIGSADLMDRNLDRRVEAVVPVEDSEARARIAEIIDLMLADDRRSWQLQPDARWVRTEVLNGRPGAVDTFEVLKERALESGAVASVPRRPGAGVGSLDPRA